MTSWKAQKGGRSPRARAALQANKRFSFALLINVEDTDAGKQKGRPSHFQWLPFSSPRPPPAVWTQCRRGRFDGAIKGPRRASDRSGRAPGPVRGELPPERQKPPSLHKVEAAAEEGPQRGPPLSPEAPPPPPGPPDQVRAVAVAAAAYTGGMEEAMPGPRDGGASGSGLQREFLLTLWILFSAIAAAEPVEGGARGGRQAGRRKGRRGIIFRLRRELRWLLGGSGRSDDGYRPCRRFSSSSSRPPALNSFSRSSHRRWLSPSSPRRRRRRPPTAQAPSLSPLIDCRSVLQLLRPHHPARSSL